MGGIVSRDAGATAATTLADGLERAARQLRNHGEVAARQFGERAAVQLRIATFYLSVAAVLVAIIIAAPNILGMYFFKK